MKNRLGGQTSLQTHVGFISETDHKSLNTPQSLEIPHQMEYLTKLYEEFAVPHESINLTIGNKGRLL